MEYWGNGLCWSWRRSLPAVAMSDSKLPPLLRVPPFSTPTLELFLEKNIHIAIKKVELHKMLYTLCRNLHEQTLSFAVADEIENPTL
jgi:hypothetical protein